MKVMRDFLCPTCGVFERFIDHRHEVCECECGLVASRQLSAPRSNLEGFSGDFPDAHTRWAKIREDNARIKARKGNTE